MATGFSHRHKAHVIHFDSQDARQWVDDNLTEMLLQMNVEEEYALAGRLWLSEITRMIRKGYKVIIVVSRDMITSRFEVILNQIIFKQNSKQSCLIPIMFNCTVNDFDENLKTLLLTYVLLYHDQSNLFDHLKQAICDRCS